MEPNPPPGGRVPFRAEDVIASDYAAFRNECLAFGFLPAFRHGILMDAAMIDPGDQSAVAAIRRLTHLEVRRFGISESDFDRAVAHLDSSLGESRKDSPDDADAPAPMPDSWDFHRHGARAVAHRMVACAFAAGASDLLLDDQESSLDVAFKLHGKKAILPPLSKEDGPALFKAFKELAGISTASTGTWQSGSASLGVTGNRTAELRVEITPTIHGESLAARVQDRRLQLERMRRLPFSDAGQLSLAEACLRRRQGLIVVAGPTGHGKTSTLYSFLGRLDPSSLNIRTLEDPVEFPIPWITQIPVGADTGRGFAQGLKSLLRQAPDVILLGEIRDPEAARICIEAVDTGHLILATLHAADAVGVATRLLDLGLTGRQVSGSLLLAVGQRLLRRLCPRCRRAAAPTAGEAARFRRHGLSAPEVLWLPQGCPACAWAGERGVVPIFEMFCPAQNAELADQIGRSDCRSFDERGLRERWTSLGGSSMVREGLRLAAGAEVAAAEALKYESEMREEPPPG